MPHLNPLGETLSLEPDLPPACEARSSGLRPFCGWALEIACRLEHQTGIRLVVPLCAASILRRAAAFLALAAWEAPDRRLCDLFEGMAPGEFVEWMFAEDPMEIAEVLNPVWRDPRKLALLGHAPLLQPTDYWHPSTALA